MARPADALAGGRAPRAWRARTAASAAAPAAWKRASAWLGELLCPPRALREGPLWGRTLEALTGAPERPREEEAPARRGGARPEPPRRQAARSPSDPRHADRRRRSERPAARRREEPPAAARPLADRELLTRLAGPPEQPSPPASRSSKAPNFPPSRPGAAAVAAPGTAAPGRTARDWFDGLGQRLRRKLRRSESPQRAKPPAAGTEPSSHPGTAALGGEEASRTFLENCLARGRSARTSPPRTTPVSEPKAPESRLLEAPAPPRILDGATPPANGAAQPADPRGGKVDLPSAPGPGDLPSLLPRRAADFTPAAAAAQVLRLAGQRGPETAAASDGELAERLGRILAEEARRHGIDV